MYKLLGLNPETNREVYVSPGGHLHFKLDKCPHCGSADTYTYDLSVGICKECFSRLNTFRQRRGRTNATSRPETIKRFCEDIHYYIALRDSGVSYMLPTKLDETLVEAQRLLDYALSEQADMTRFAKPLYGNHKCKECGYTTEVGIAYGGRVRCPACAKRYDRYRWLVNRIADLTDDQKAELSGILDEYTINLSKGRWAPNIPAIRQKL